MKRSAGRKATTVASSDKPISTHSVGVVFQTRGTGGAGNGVDMDGAAGRRGLRASRPPGHVPAM